MLSIYKKRLVSYVLDNFLVNIIFNSQHAIRD